MKHEIVTQWMGKMQFNALINGHTVIMDAPPRVGGEDNGPIPKPFVLSALSGCTGMDVVALLRKDGRELDDFEIQVSGEITRQHPITYVGIHIIYELKGKPEDQDAAMQAITRSQEELCGVSYMLKKIMPVTWDVNYNGVLVFTNHIEGIAQLN